MAGSASEWSRYLRWNDAIATVVYTTEQAGRPVYLDLEDDVLAAIRDAAEPDSDSPAVALVAATRGTLPFIGGAAAVLRGHFRRLAEWERTGSLEPPPVLGLLATLSLAAENMRDDDQFAANNFYDRLQELLEVDKDGLRWFQNAYRQSLADGTPASAWLWGALNSWLERLEGNRGLPTAYVPPDVHRHVGLPLSQALVRASDRERFEDLFLTYGLPPHTVMHPDEMHPLISEWQSRVPSPTSNVLRRLWKHDGARARITSVACQVLEAWDGDGSPAGGTSTVRRVDRVKMKAQLRTFPRQRIDISLVLAAPRSDADEVVTVVVDTTGDELGELECTNTASGWLTLADPESIDARSFLEGEIQLRRANGDVLRRRAKLVVPLRKDELLLGFVECERVTLGDEMILLVRDDLIPKLAHVLPSVARPGYQISGELPGLPPGWTLVQDVQVLSSVPDEVLSGQRVDFNVLQTIATEQIALGGGMSLPGNIRKWASARPPEVRVTAPGKERLVATLTGTPLVIDEVSIEPRTRSTNDPVLVWDLADEDLADGDCELVVSDGRVPLGRPEPVRLRSADVPAVVLDRTPLTHAPASFPFDALGASTAERLMCFAVVPDPYASLAGGVAAAPTTSPAWYAARRSLPIPTAPAAPLHLPSSAKGACMLTGSHVMALEMALTGMRTVEGVCKSCGLIKRYPATAQHARKKRVLRSAAAASFKVSALPSTRPIGSVDWELGFDVLCHVGGGPIAALERVAAQMDPTSLFADAFCRRLEALGHIEVQRDPHTLAPKSWEVSDPVLIGLRGGDAVLTGFRSSKLRRALNDAAEHSGLWIHEDLIDAPARIRIELPTSDRAEVFLEAMRAVTGRTVRYVPEAAQVLADSLPTLSQVLATLATTSFVGGKSFERWDPIAARFQPATDAGLPGTYRVTGNFRHYIYRTANDIASMTARAGDARIVKYATALESGHGLVGYSADEEVLYVPLGADLPGLFGRAAVLASGRPPHENMEDRLLEYHRVTPLLAGTLIKRLTT